MTKKDLKQLESTIAAIAAMKAADTVLSDIVDELDSDVMNAVYEVREAIETAMDVIADCVERTRPIFVAACDEEKSKC